MIACTGCRRVRKLWFDYLYTTFDKVLTLVIGDGLRERTARGKEREESGVMNTPSSVTHAKQRMRPNLAPTASFPPLKFPPPPVGSVDHEHCIRVSHPSLPLAPFPLGSYSSLLTTWHPVGPHARRSMYAAK